MYIRDHLDQLGKPYTIYARDPEEASLQQFLDVMKLDCILKGALMADAHCGYVMPIGGVVASDSTIFPGFVGYDIGCGVLGLPTTFREDDIRKYKQEIFDSIYREIPVGYNQNSVVRHHSVEYQPNASKVMRKILGDKSSAQLGTLGSGNHFCEIGVDGSGVVWIVIHSGSRNLGHQVASHYMKLAAPKCGPVEGPWGLSDSSDIGKDYIQDMNICLSWALANREDMALRIFKVISKLIPGHKFDWSQLINRNHNHAERRLIVVDNQDKEVWIHRKGATHAEKGMPGLIPGNMRDGTYVTKGKGNPDSLYSSSHGAGRTMGRKQAQRNLDMSVFEDQMDGILAKVTKDTLDESPSAYKDIHDVMSLQMDLLYMVDLIKPIINIKG